MRKIAIILTCVFTILVATGVGVCYTAFDTFAKTTANVSSNGGTTRQYTVGEFHSIEANGPVIITIVDGTSHQIFAKGDSKLLDKMQVSVKDGELKIKFPNEICNKSSKKIKPVEVQVERCELRSVELSQSAQLKTTSLTSDKKLEIEISTGSSLEVQSIVATEIEIDAETSGSIKIDEIQGNTVEIDGETSATVKIRKVTVNKTKLSADTAASISIENLTTNSVEADADTAADIEIAGTAKTAVLKADTAGTVHAKKLTCPSIKKYSDTAGSVKI